MRLGKFKITGDADGRPLRGQDVRVVVVGPNGEELLVPALSLVLRIGSRHEQAIATIEVPAIMVDLDGVELKPVPVVDPDGPRWDEVIGAREGEKLADVEAYADNPHLVVGDPEYHGTAARPAVDPMAELDAVIANGGKVS